VSPYRWVVRITSPTFGVGSGEKRYTAESEVIVMPTAAIATEDRKAALSARGYACFAREESSSISSGPRRGGGVVHLGRRVLSRLPSPLPGVDGSFEWREAETETETLPNGRRTRSRGYLNLLGFVFGRAEITLYTLAVSRPVPAATERRLLSLLYSRAKAHKLDRPAPG
jgi:hypothetical protein